MRKVNCKPYALEGMIIAQVGAAVWYKEKVGRLSFKELTHWGRAMMFREDWKCKPGSLGAYLMETRATLGTQTGYLYQVSWDAQNENCAKLLTEDQWGGCTRNPGLNPETKGDLIEWVLVFTSIGFFYPLIYDIWGKQKALQAMKHISQEAKRYYFQRGEVAVVLRNIGSLTDDEEMETARPLQGLIAMLDARDAREEAEQRADAGTTATTAAGTRRGNATDTPPTPGPHKAGTATTASTEDHQTGTSHAGPGANPFAHQPEKQRNTVAWGERTRTSPRTGAERERRAQHSPRRTQCKTPSRTQ